MNNSNFTKSPNTKSAFREGMFDGMNGKPSRAGVLYKPFSSNWKAYTRAYQVYSKRRIYG